MRRTRRQHVSKKWSSDGSKRCNARLKRRRLVQRRNNGRSERRMSAVNASERKLRRNLLRLSKRFVNMHSLWFHH